MEKSYNKIIAVAFVAAAALFGYTISVIMKVLMNTWGAFARLVSSPAIEHGIPIAAAAIFFFALILSPKIRAWAGDVAGEISKIVWPSVKDTRALTVVVCIIILICAVLFAIFDMVSSQVVEFILDLEV